MVGIGDAAGFGKDGASKGSDAVDRALAERAEGLPRDLMDVPPGLRDPVGKLDRTGAAEPRALRRPGGLRAGVAVGAVLLRPGLGGAGSVRSGGRVAMGRADLPLLDSSSDRVGPIGSTMMARLAARQQSEREVGRRASGVPAVPAAGSMVALARAGVAYSAAIDRRRDGASASLSATGGAARPFTPVLRARTEAVRTEAVRTGTPRVGLGLLTREDGSRLLAGAGQPSPPRSATSTSALVAREKLEATEIAGPGGAGRPPAGGRVEFALAPAAPTIFKAQPADQLAGGTTAGRADAASSVQRFGLVTLVDRVAGRIGDGGRVGLLASVGPSRGVVGSVVGGVTASGRARSSVDGLFGSAPPGVGPQNGAVEGAAGEPSGSVSGGWAGPGSVFPAGVATPAAAGSSGGGGSVMLDGRLVGRWITDRMGREAERAPAGMTRFDARQSAAWRSSSAM